MKKRTTYIIIGIVLFVLVMLSAVSKMGDLNTERLSTKMENSSFSNQDKKAGGAYVAFKTLPELFASHAVQVVTKPFNATFEKESELRFPGNNYILLANELFTTEKDVEAMMECVRRGNYLFLAVNKMDPLLAKQLRFKVVEGSDYQPGEPTKVQRYIDPLVPLDTAYNYSGMIAGSYFSRIDTAYTTVLGNNYKEKPNFIRILHGRGCFFISLNPYTFTNYFLLEKQNIAALETQLSYMPDDASNVYWDDFYSHQSSAQSGDFSEWQVLMRYPAMRWALWLAVLLLLLYVVFEGKRRQRIIPDKPALVNNSLEFVDAIGQLYYQQHNNYNLAHKMTLHLLEYIRNRYYLNTNHLNTQFVETLSKKSAMPESEVRELTDTIHRIQLAEQVSDEQLQHFYQRIQHFYLNTK
ncbi:DUF4350 domain-containing protein [Chitinophaga qingshengii]|uniref:DUF4350 domain-containing protein n=1 Tax=Chitinophaga qingshengii TaxID=1569794 RepID=A0ABR7TY18_9BACT|nr:DUF4350 domain-containing protein [Chitinophaga qingshengii]MBC9934588.1 DUF4350 domain-containing protein [Chitinophaga qingshengii]